MVTVKLTRNTANCIVAVNVTGHADYAPHGEDIVCAAVSALTQTALVGLLRYAQYPVEYKMKAGFLSFHLQKEPAVVTDTILETMSLGLEEIARSYPDRVQIKEHRR